MNARLPITNFKNDLAESHTAALALSYGKP